MTSQESHNPNYRPPKSAINTTTVLTRTAFRGLTFFAVANDGVCLARAYQTSQQTGSREPIKRESARVAGGWSGALAGGSLGSRAGAAVGALFGPWGALGGAVVGGVGGSILGYGKGSDTAVEIYDVTRSETQTINSP